MADNKIMRSIVEKCEFLYDDALISEEEIIKAYLIFFATQFDPNEKSVSFVFHTGSVCFDIVSVAALMIGCLNFGFSSNDEILSELKTGDMVLFKDERYRWHGIEKICSKTNDFKTDYIILKQDAKGKNGPLSSYFPYKEYKHLIKPYFGDSSVTDGRGIRKENSNRNDFISYILEISPSDVPSELDLSVVVVADKNKFVEICRHLKIRYKGDKTVELLDIVPVTYYSGNEEQFQIGKNASKAEAVIKVTSKMSTARNLVLDRNGNKVVGIMVTDVDFLSADSAELKDLLRRRTLKFAYIIAPFSVESCELMMEQYESAEIFACTKGLLSDSGHAVKVSNKLTEELNQQISNILTRETKIIRSDGYWSWEQFKAIKDKLFAIKQSNWSGEDRDQFIMSALALINLFSHAFFPLIRMENAIKSGEISFSVVSPEKRIEKLMEIASGASSMKEQCTEITSVLLNLYSDLYDNSPKEEKLLGFLREHKDKKIAIVFPKAYFVDLFAIAFGSEFENVICVTANRFDKSEEYDIVISTGDYIGKRFDAVRCFSAPLITLFLYEYEEKTYSYRRKRAEKSERKLYSRIKRLNDAEYVKETETTEYIDTEITDSVMQEFSDLDEFVKSIGMFDPRKLTTGTGGNRECSNTAEVKFIGLFTTGEQILFSKYYSAVVFDQMKGVVTETSPDKLLPGDILIFTKRNDYTHNIVDQIFSQLMRAKKLSSDVQHAAEKASYWKKALREYKDSNELTYRDVTKELQKRGSRLKEVTIRQWLVAESHIIGPKEPETMRIIAEVTKDSDLLDDPEGFFEACRVVRHYRREILSLIARAISDKLSNKHPTHGSEFEVVYKNIEKLSETMELENIYELDNVAVVSNGIVNRPISESEVLM